MRAQCAVFVLLLTAVCHAEEKASWIKREGFGSAGCGFGSMLMGPDGNQILAATTNTTSGSQTFGISSGSLNCRRDQVVIVGREIPMYIEVNRMALANDAARGQGETLAGLASLMSCDEHDVGEILKKNYKKIFVETHMRPERIQANIIRVISESDILCGG